MKEKDFFKNNKYYKSIIILLGAGLIISGITVVIKYKKSDGFTNFTTAVDTLCNLNEYENLKYENYLNVHTCNDFYVIVESGVHRIHRYYDKNGEKIGYFFQTDIVGTSNTCGGIGCKIDNFGVYKLDTQGSYSENAKSKYGCNNVGTLYNICSGK